MCYNEDIKEMRDHMDGYAQMMLHDDVSSREEITIKCPSCQLDIKLKLSDHFIKCKRCGEMFYLEEILDENY
jgi:ssDNA-binding Zn-finger/Zn-ribbon topoisomerase 1